MEDVFLALQSTGVAQSLRFSRWAYPIVNIIHLLGIAVLFGSILALDLRILGLWRSVDVDEVSRPAISLAAGALVVAIASGLLLFSVRAEEYGGMTIFWVKMGLVAAGTANALLARAMSPEGNAPVVAAAVSLVCWTGAIAAGRLIGYWDA